MITGAIAGVFLADYWILKATILDIKELYSATGVNWHLGFSTVLPIGSHVWFYIPTFTIQINQM